MTKSKEFIKRRPKDVFSVGINAHKNVDNLITLFRSSNDLFDGTVDYIFYRVLGCDPIMYHNISEERSYEDLDEINFNYSEFDSKFTEATNEVLAEQLELCIKYIRKKALAEQKIKLFARDIYICDEAKFDAVYILRKMFDFFKEIKAGYYGNMEELW